MAKNKLSLTVKILIGMIGGFILGGLFNWLGTEGPVTGFVVQGVFYVVGQIFLAALKLLVVPLVFVSLVCGTAALDDLKKLGRIGGKTLALYLMTTCIAVTLALTAAMLIQPGVGFELTSEAVFQAKEAPSVSQVLINLFPTNPIKAMAEGNMLQIIVFSILFGVALTLAGKQGEMVLNVFESANHVIMKMVLMLMEMAPYGVFCLIAQVFAREGFQAIIPLSKYFFVVLGVLAFSVIVTYPVILKTFTGLSPIVFF